MQKKAKSKSEERRIKAMKPAKDKMVRSSKNKVECTPAHESQCRNADPKNAGDCDCRCHGENHGADRK